MNAQVCEIGKGSVAKYEIHKSFPYNAVVQDAKCAPGNGSGSGGHKTDNGHDATVECKLRQYRHVCITILWAHMRVCV
jgi:hypothetical protein